MEALGLDRATLISGPDLLEQSDGKYAKKTGEECEDFLNYIVLHKHNLYKKLHWKLPKILKKSTGHLFGYLTVDAGLNISWFLRVMAFPKPMRL